MNLSKTLFNQLVSEITSVYEENEAKSIVYLLLEHYLKISKTDILLDNPVAQLFDFTEIIQRIKAQEPVQYIIGETEFYGRKFNVTPDTLIPRPETEELVLLTVNSYQLAVNKSHFEVEAKILDIGTGTGCIAISLACELPNSQVYAYDISENALKVAKENAERNGVKVIFEKTDFLTLKPNPQPLKLTIIVSNPPYVMNSEKLEMERNVLEYEPHLALFVDDDNPLIFYKKIAEFAAKNLVESGLCVVEINQALGLETAELFWNQGFHYVEVVKDMFGKDRMVKAIK
ncbi:peptide chain release factor N(5)-glutamine methyltransferase [Arcicella sp. LKC2W]|uniref:peptide chain release factor N(5)-glutamine methyltransferase n=1 Tax=Arcicella sp. LKC2W TaxID=2984198 RepID=UPI002B1FD58A|nr:peptide chain release factor N(5)-glutamine methyltransferase [Arcicella sp. LKC2W]MEA5457956.1 peptide chain release factor N(5)-glutamine methyltransferase [Arcicella sp. LKC2W]